MRYILDDLAYIEVQGETRPALIGPPSFRYMSPGLGGPIVVMSLTEGSTKPVLVFDLDETLIASEKTYDDTMREYTISKIIVNDKMLDIIHNGKEKGYLVLLLTNNENGKVIFEGEEGRFVDVCLGELLKAYNEKYTPVEKLFDITLTAERDGNPTKRTYLKKRIDIYYKNKNGQNRIRYYAKPVKSLQDVRNMLGYNVKGGDVYFFDDDNKHQLCGESKFIHITPPFSGKGDETNYSLLNTIHIQTAGRRTRRKRRGSKGRKLKDIRDGM